METNTEQPPEKEKDEDPKPTDIKQKSKIDSYIKFKTPNEKSPKKAKIESKDQKTPVKIDVLVETAMPSWSDNSSNDIIKPISEPMDVDKKEEVTVIEDSEDIKLVYEETEGTKSETQSPNEKKVEATNEVKTKNNSPPSIFLKQAKVTDTKQPVALKSAPSPKAPRRVNFVTLSSPKNSKKK